MTTDNNPASLLTTALEKLLYLESRLDSAEAARDESSREAERQRLATQAARQALADWQRRATDAEVATEGAQREVSVLRDSLARARNAINDEPHDAETAAALAAAQERLERFERERESWLDRMATLQRLGSGGDELDLGAFISELRAELLALRRGETDRPRATVSDRPSPPEPRRILDEFPSGAIEVEGLLHRARLSHSERTLASLCAKDLASDTAVVRLRAAQRLLEARIAALGPLVASLLAREPDVQVRVAEAKLLALSESETAVLALKAALGDSDPRVRVAALEALAHRPDVDLSPGLRDESPAVRRRTLSLLRQSPDRIDQYAAALHDGDASVRHVAAIAIGSQTGAEADALLRIAAQSADSEVQSAARHSLKTRGKELAVEEPAKVVVDETATLKLRIMDDIGASLRGRSVDELVRSLNSSAEAVQPLVDALIDGKKIVWRGRRLYQR